MLILAGKVVFADRPPDTVEYFKRLAVGMQGLALTTCEAPRFQDRLDPVLLVLLGDGREAQNFPLLLAEDVADEIVFVQPALMENRNGLIVGAVTTRASGHAERLAALPLIEPHAERPQPVTLGADKGYDAGEKAGSRATLRWRNADSNHRSHRERNGRGEGARKIFPSQGPELNT